VALLWGTFPVKIKALAVAAVAAAVLMMRPAHAVTIPFSFTDATGTVSGELVGLANNGFSSATQVIIESAPAALGIPFGLPLDLLSTPPGTLTLVDANSFLLTNGVITGGALVFSRNYALPIFTPQNWEFCLAVAIAGYCGAPTSAYLKGPGGIVQSDVALGAAPAATPLPAALPLFSAGLGALGLLGWRRKKKKAAALAA
jgi:hypothetical protein